MRILFVSNTLDYASATTYSYDLAQALVARGDQVQLCTTGGDLLDDFRGAGIETYVVRFNLLSFRKLLQFLSEFDPEIIHVQNLRSAPLGRRLATKLNKPYVVTAHSRSAGQAPPLADRLLRGVVAVNEVIREALVNSQNLPKHLTRVIPRGVDLSRLVPEPLWPGPHSGRIPVIGSVGRLSREKGHHCLIAASRRVLDRGIEAHFVIVGEGDEESRLRQLVKEMSLDQHVTFSPHISALNLLYRLFDIVALPVLRSGVGVTALEAMAMGRPVIASAVGEMLTFIQDGTTGLLVPEGDAATLADRIVELLQQPELMATLGKYAREWVGENFAFSRMVDATQEFYESVLARLEEEEELVGGTRRRG